MTRPGAKQVLPLRKLIHLAGSVFPLLYLFAPRQVVLWAATIVLVLTLSVEWGRQHASTLERLFEWLIGSALREGEQRKPTTGTWSMLGILISVLNIILKQADKEEQAQMLTLAGVVVVLIMVVRLINDLFNMVRSVFHLF